MQIPPMTDQWRAEMLETLPYLRGQSFVRKSYRAYRPDWEHDHCAVCGVTFAEEALQGEAIIHDGYATTSNYKHGEDYEWVCVDCFRASKNAMDWKDVTAD